MCKIASWNTTELPDRLRPDYEIVVDRSIHQASNPFLTDPTAGFPDVSGIQLNMVGVISAFVVPPFQMREESTKPGELLLFTDVTQGVFFISVAESLKHEPMIRGSLKPGGLHGVGGGFVGLFCFSVLF